jgi:nicotinamidase-related amidase
MQRDFLDPGGYLASAGYSVEEARKPIEPAQRLLSATRAAGGTVVYTRQGYRPGLEELPDHRLARSRDGNSLIGGKGPLGRFLIRGEDGFQIIPELAPLPGDPVVDKSGCGAFWGTDLAAVLAAKGIRRLVFAGVTTDVCVHCTLREANDRGFECLLVEDACGSGSEDAHRAAVDQVTVENGVFGVVADVAAVETALRNCIQKADHAS